MPQTTTPRMQQLQRLLERQPDDTFLLYGLGLEYKKINETKQALEYLNRVIELDRGYCYAYHQKGQTYEQLGDFESAKQAYRDGIQAARNSGDSHALGEIEAALAELE